MKMEGSSFNDLVLSLGCVGGLQFKVGTHYHFIEAKVRDLILVFNIYDFKDPIYGDFFPISSISYGISF